MFTGIIEELGAVVAVQDVNEIRKLRIGADRVLQDIHTGASIAVSGVCLTVTGFDASGFNVDVVRETMNRSSLNDAGIAKLVNLERPMRADGRFDGHIVQGHVDAVGRIANFDRQGDNWNLDVEFPPEFAKYIVEKGSIAVDGISLTLAGVDKSRFRVAIIPHTHANTNLKQAQPGNLVNLEFDVVAKYVEKMVAGFR